MKITKIENYKDGWFVGNFEPSCYKTENFEVGYKIHKKGEYWEAHYHKKITEINFLISGKMTIQNQELNSGDVFVIYPNEIADPVFLEDCYLCVIKTPSVVGDKTLV
jgi:quercetin dioxygenase-like cupin family protein